MTKKDISILLRKAEELRSLFILGQRVIPFLEEIFIFVSDIEPILHEINTSIKDNLKKMPKASKQLSKVTEATELATNEILDILDGLSYKNNIITSNLSKISELISNGENKSLNLLKMIVKSADNGQNINEYLPQIKDFISVNENELNNKIAELITNTLDLNNSIVNDSSAIAMSLQVQDITSQQIAAVNNLLETVQSRLSVIMEKFKSSELESIIRSEVEEEHTQIPKVTQLHRTIAYDPDAVDSLDATKNRQGDVDEIFNLANNLSLDALEKEFQEPKHTKLDEIVNEPIVETITNNTNTFDDNIVENNLIVEEKTQEENTEILDNVDNHIEIMGDLDDEISQDDIDALFGKL